MYLPGTYFALCPTPTRLNSLALSTWTHTPSPRSGKTTSFYTMTLYETGYDATAFSTDYEPHLKPFPVIYTSLPCASASWRKVSLSLCVSVSLLFFYKSAHYHSPLFFFFPFFTIQVYNFTFHVDNVARNYRNKKRNRIAVASTRRNLCKMGRIQLTASFFNVL